MSYSTKRYDPDEAMFPPPPQWLVWMGYGYWDDQSRSYVEDGQGQVRHYATLSKAKKFISNFGEYGSGNWRFPWRLYRWDGNAWVLEYSAVKGEQKSKNPLWQIRVKTTEVQPVGGYSNLDKEIEEALQSIGKVNV